jgi:membrane carboxypeptidase/penicillin-binding protein
MDKEHSVGRGKPPIKHQFKKGKSGNPSGRRRKHPRYAPKEPLDFQRAVIAELQSAMMIVDDGKKKKITKLEAFVKLLIARSLKDDRSATKAVLALIEKLPKDAFVDNGNEVYTYRITRAQLEAQEQFLALCVEYERELAARDNAGSRSPSSAIADQDQHSGADNGHESPGSRGSDRDHR